MSTDRVLLPSAVKPSLYKLELTPDLQLLTFSCDEESDAGATVKAIEIAYHLKLTTVKLTFDGALPCGQGKILIKYTGILNGDMAGFYKSAYTDADGQKKVMASTQFEALDARRAFPCWDEPGIKAKFAVTLIVEKHLCAISNMPEISCEHVAGGKKKLIFQESPQMSTYLLAWAIGEFDFVQASTKNGIVIRVFSPPGRAEQGRFALDCGVRALDFYDEFFKVPYPLPKLDMICITEFAMGAMENWGLVTYREVDLMIDEMKASSQQKQRVAIVVAHELAHQWFGNLVTMSWWDGLWLNEGFAAFSEHFCVDALYPDYRIWEQYTTDAFGAAQRLDSLRTSHPIIVPIKHAEEVEQVFDAISYCKGSTVVNMVQAILGKEKFQEGLQKYMSSYAYKNTETNDLWQAWTDVSGIPVAKLMKTWTMRMGYPYLKVVSEKWSDNAVEFTLEQNWFLADGSEVPAEEAADALWSIPLLFATSACVSEKAVIMDEKTKTFSVPLSGPNDWLKINAGQKALARVLYTPTMMQRMLAPLRAKSMAPIDRASVLLDAFALAKSGAGSIDQVVEILKCLDQEDSETVWSALAGVLSALYMQMEQIGGSAFEAFMQFGKTIVVNGLAKVGWDPKETDGHTDKLMRSTIIGLLDAFAYSDPQVLAEARRRYDEHWADPSALPSDYKSTVYKIVLKNGGKAEYDAIKAIFYASEDNALKKTAFAIGATPSKELKLATLDWAVKSGDVKLQDFFYPIAPVASSSEGADLAWGYYKENFDLIKEKLSKASPSLMDAAIVYSTNKFCTNEKAKEMEDFFASHPLPQSARRISQSIEMIRSAGKLFAIVQKSKLASASFWA